MASGHTVPSDRALHSAQRIALKLMEAFPAYWNDFDAKWKSWKQAISPSAEPSTWSSVPEFNALIALGPKIVPLVVWKVACDFEDPTAVYLYNNLEPNPTFHTNPLPLNSQASALLEKNFTRTREIRNALLNWSEYCDMVSLSSNAAERLVDIEYDALVEMGVSIVPQLMLEYVKPEGGGLQFSFELLHEIIWGYQAGFQTMFLGELREQWVGWFERGDFGEAPRYLRREDRGEE